LYRDGCLYGDVVVRCAVALHKVFGVVLAVGQLADGLAGTPLGVGDHLLEGSEDDLPAPAFDQLAYALFGDVVRGDLGAQVAATEVGRTNVGEQEVEDVVYVLASPDQTDRRDDHTLLEDLARVGGHGAGAHPAHV
jgi:hypothetical protein